MPIDAGDVVARAANTCRGGGCTFNLNPVLKQSDLMWFHERMRGGQQVFEFTGIDVAHVHYFKRREDGDYQYVRREEYAELLSDEFLNLMAGSQQSGISGGVDN